MRLIISILVFIIIGAVVFGVKPEREGLTQDEHENLAKTAVQVTLHAFNFNLNKMENWDNQSAEILAYSLYKYALDDETLDATKVIETLKLDWQNNEEIKGHNLVENIFQNINNTMKNHFFLSDVKAIVQQNNVNVNPTILETIKLLFFYLHFYRSLLHHFLQNSNSPFKEWIINLISFIETPAQALRGSAAIRKFPIILFHWATLSDPSLPNKPYGQISARKSLDKKNPGKEVKRTLSSLFFANRTVSNLFPSEESEADPSTSKRPNGQISARNSVDKNIPGKGFHKTLSSLFLEDRTINSRFSTDKNEANGTEKIDDEAEDQKLLRLKDQWTDDEDLFSINIDTPTAQTPSQHGSVKSDHFSNLNTPQTRLNTPQFLSRQGSVNSDLFSINSPQTLSRHGSVKSEHFSSLNTPQTHFNTPQTLSRHGSVKSDHFSNLNTPQTHFNTPQTLSRHGSVKSKHFSYPNTPQTHFNSSQTLRRHGSVNGLSNLTRHILDDEKMRKVSIANMNIR